jgi:DNA-directed RNA polymerase subunit RPC12/RpoP
MNCPECNGNMILEPTPFQKKVNGERKFFVSYVCENCGAIVDELADSGKKKKVRFQP